MTATNKLFMLVPLVIFALFSCSSGVKGELKEYEGIRLSPSSVFRENSIKGVQRIKAEEYSLEITGLVNKDRKYSLEEIKAMPSVKEVVQMKCVEGWDATILWEGVRFSEIVSGTAIDSSAVTVIFHCEDGYTTSMPQAYVIEKDLLLAYGMNGVDLPARLGYPLTLIAEGKWGYKWARWVVKIEFSSNPDHRGFWEKRGYSNDAALENSFFER